MSKKQHGNAKHEMWAAHNALFSRAEGDASVESNPDLAGPIGVLADPAADSPTYGPVNTTASTSTPTYSPYVTPTIPVPDFTTPTSYGPVNPSPTNPAASGGGLAADFARQTSTIAGTTNLLTQGVGAATTIAKQIGPLTKKGKKNAATTTTDTKPITGGGGGKGTGTKVAGMSTPVIAVLAIVGIVGVGLVIAYATGYIGGGSSSTGGTVVALPNLVNKAA